MKIAVLSDTHNNLPNLDVALARIRQEQITTIIHCGDMTSPETAHSLAGFRVIFVYGNGDIASGEIRETLRALNPESSAGMSFTGDVGGAHIAAVHGHIPGLFEELLETRIYEYIFTGHSHHQRDTQMKNTRVINPGALGGLQREPRQFCLLDLATGAAQYVHV